MIETLKAIAYYPIGLVNHLWNILLVLTIVPTSSLPAYWHTIGGMRSAKRGDKLGAYHSFVRAIESEPNDPLLQINLALVFEWNEELEKAAQTYESVRTEFEKKKEYLDKKIEESFRDVRTKGLSLQRVVAFNLGNVMAASKRIPDALKNYQIALDEGGQPDKVKTNIELLFKKGGGQGDGDSNDQQDPQNDPKKGDQSKDGKGKPDKNQDKDDKDDKDKRDNQKKREDSLKDQGNDKDKDKDKGKSKPKPFDSQDLKPEDVKRILDEIKNQEQSIRAQEYDKQPKEGARGGKDW